MRLNTHIRRRLIDTFLFMLVSTALTLIWFRNGFPISYAEAGLFMYNPERMIHFISYQWYDHSTGMPALRILAAAPIFIFLRLLEILGLSPLAREAILFSMILFASGLSMYYLSSVLTTPKMTRLSCILAGIYYMVNSYAMTYVWNRFLLSLMVAYPFVPLSLALFIKGIKEKRLYYAFFISLSSLMFSSFIIVIPLTIPFLLMSYYIFFIVWKREIKNIVYGAVFSIITGLSWLAFNLWQTIPLLMTCNWGGFQDPEYVIRNALKLSMIDALRTNFYFESNKYIWHYYQSGLIAGMGLIIPILAFSSVLIERKFSEIYYFVGLATLGIYLASIFTTPIASMVKAFGQYLPLPLYSLSINNLTSEKALLIVILCFSVLFGFTAGTIYERLNRVAKMESRADKFRRTTTLIRNPNTYKLIKKTSSILLILLILSSVSGLNVLPMWTGEVFTYSFNTEGDHIGYSQLPAYYAEANKWLSSQAGYFRILSLPLVHAKVRYLWQPPFNAETPDWRIFDRPVIASRDIVIGNPPISGEIIQRLMYFPQGLAKIAGFLNVKYIVLHYDLDYNFFGYDNPDEIRINYLDNILEPSHILYTIPVNSGWSVVAGKQPIYLGLDTLDKVKGNESLVASGYQDSLSGFGIVYRLPASMKDWSSARFIEFWIKTNVAGNLEFSIWDKKGVGCFYDIYNIAKEEVNRWNPITLYLSKPRWCTSDRFDVNSVDSVVILIYPLTNMSLINIKLSDIEIRLAEIKKNEYLIFEKQFGAIYVYKVKDEAFAPRIFAVDNLKFFNDLDSMLEYVVGKAFVPLNEVLFLTTQLSVNNATLLNIIQKKHLSVPHLSFTSVNPTKYEINIVNATSPFFLVFSETYDLRWQAIINGRTVPNEYHFIGNGYANVWYIDKLGTYDITLEFIPQQIFYYSLVGSFVAITGCVLLFLVRRYYFSYSKFLE